MGAPQTDQDTKAGIIGGLLFVFLGFTPEEAVKTSLLAAIGATVSFLVTLFFKWIIRQWKTRK